MVWNGSTGNRRSVFQQPVRNPTRNELWNSLSLTGNWGNRKLDSNGDGDFTDEEDRDEPLANNTFNKANEWTSRRVQKAAANDRDQWTYTYDAAGQLTKLELDRYRGVVTSEAERTLVYDAFGRLVRVEGFPTESGPFVIAKYRYNGLGYRIMWQYDLDADATLEDGERYYFAYDERWRMVASFRNQDASPKETFVYHAAGRQGFGGSSYIDSVILRDRDENTSSTPNPWTSASDGTLEERRFYLQNWRADVVAVVKDDGTPWEYIRYSSYGEATSYPVADINRDGVVDEADKDDWLNLKDNVSNNAAVAADLNRNGEGPSADSGDDDLFYDSYGAHEGLSGKGRLSAGGIGSGSPTGTMNRKGYAGYEWDPVISMYHVRHRVYVPEIGRWMRRDPLGYVDGMSVYEYVGSCAILGHDPLGLYSIEDCARQHWRVMTQGRQQKRDSPGCFGNLFVDLRACCSSYLGVPAPRPLSAVDSYNSCLTKAREKMEGCSDRGSPAPPPPPLPPMPNGLPGPACGAPCYGLSLADCTACCNLKCGGSLAIDCQSACGIGPVTPLGPAPGPPTWLDCVQGLCDWMGSITISIVYAEH